MAQEEASTVKYLLKMTVGTAAAYVLGKSVMEIMNEDHRYDAGAVEGSYKERKERTSTTDGSKNWFGTQYFINKDGIAVYWRCWLPESKPKALVIISHGMGEHSGRYEKLGAMLKDAGYAVYALDHQGHGQSEGSRLHVKWFGDFVVDVHQLTEMAKLKHPELTKVFLVGHSLGGLIAIHSVSEAPRLYDGVVLSAPAIQAEVPPGALTLLPFIASWVPKLPTIGLDLATLCRDKSVVDRYHNDPLNNQGTPTARFNSEVLISMTKVEGLASNFPIPYLLMHGTKDKLTMPAGSDMFHKTTQVEDKTLKVYEGAFHELYNEPDAEERALKDTFEWLEQRV